MNSELSYQHYRVLSLAFYPPTKQTFEALGEIDCFGGEVKGETVDTLKHEYYRLFSLSVAGGITPYETEYLRIETFQKANVLADIGGFYQAFGLEVSNTHEQRMDFIGSELDFMFWLGLKLDRANSRHKPVEAGQCESAMRKFLDDHLATWAISFANELSQESKLPFYHKLGTELLLFLASECSRFQVEPKNPPYFGMNKDARQATAPSCEGCGS